VKTINNNKTTKTRTKMKKETFYEAPKVSEFELETTNSFLEFSGEQTQSYDVNAESGDSEFE